MKSLWQVEKWFCLNKRLYTFQTDKWREENKKEAFCSGKSVNLFLSYKVTKKAFVYSKSKKLKKIQLKFSKTWTFFMLLFFSLNTWINVSWVSQLNSAWGRPRKHLVWHRCEVGWGKPTFFFLKELLLFYWFTQTYLTTVQL